jgi:hypothetical protein
VLRTTPQEPAQKPVRAFPAAPLLAARPGNPVVRGDQAIGGYSARRRPLRVRSWQKLTSRPPGASIWSAPMGRSIQAGVARRVAVDIYNRGDCASGTEALRKARLENPALFQALQSID